MSKKTRIRKPNYPIPHELKGKLEANKTNVKSLHFGRSIEKQIEYFVSLGIYTEDQFPDIVRIFRAEK